MSGYSITSQQAYRSVDLDRREREVLAHIQAHFPVAEFTRAELAESMGWAINRICGRIVSMRDKGLLIEDKQRTVTCPATAGDAHPLRLLNAVVQRADSARVGGNVGTTRSQHAPAKFTNSASAAYIAVQPTLFSTLSMTPDAAKGAPGREAELVRKHGQFRVWGDDLELCANVKRILNKP